MRKWFMIALALLIAAPVADAFADAAKVFIVPFTESDSRKPDWINRSLEQSLADELSLTKAVDVVSDNKQAQYIVSGTVQRVGGEIRVSGRVQDPAGKNIGGFKGTGTERQLFSIEDAIAVQVKSIIAPNDPRSGVVAATGPASSPTQLQAPFAPANYGSFEGSDLQRAMRDPRYLQTSAPGPTYIVQPVVYNNPPQYGYNNIYGYNNYGYGYGWYNTPSVVVVSQQNGFHRGGGRSVNCNIGGGSIGGSFVPSSNGQAIRHVASWAGNPPSAMTHTMAGAQLVPGGSFNGGAGGGGRSPGR